MEVHNEMVPQLRKLRRFQPVQVVVFGILKPYFTKLFQSNA